MGFDATDLTMTFNFLVGMTFRGTCVAAMILLLVLILRNQIRPQIRYLILFLAVLRRAVPIVRTSGLSLFNVSSQT